MRVCTQCSLGVFPKERAEDQAAILHGFCSHICRLLHASEKQFALDHANDLNPIRERGGL